MSLKTSVSISVKDDSNSGLSSFNKAVDSTLKSTESLSKKVSKSLDSFGRNFFSKITLPIAGAGLSAIYFASDMVESLNKIDVAFKSNSALVKKWSDNSLKSFGIAKGTALEMAALFGDMATSMGLTTDAAAKMSTELVGRAGDLASFKNIRIDVAQTALKSIFTGETESLKTLGVVMTEANLKAFALSEGINKNYKDMSEAEKVNLRYQYVLKATSNSQGDFERTGGGAANQTRIFTESLKELSSKFGEIILPAYTSVITKMNEYLGIIGDLSPETKKFVIILGTVAAALPVVAIGLSSIITTMTALSGALALLARISPLVLAIGAPLASVTYILYKTRDTWIPVMKEIFESIRVNFGEVVNQFIALGDNIKLTIDTIMNNWKYFVEAYGVNISAWVESVKSVLTALFGAIKLIFVIGWETVKFVVSGAFSEIMTIFNVSLDILRGDWGKAWEDIVSLFSTIFGNVGETAKNILGAVVSYIDNVVSGIRSALSALSKLKEAVSIGSKLNTAIENSQEVQSKILSGTLTKTDIVSQRAKNRDTGGFVKAGETYTVGERGAETFVPQVNGYIRPSTGSNITINLSGVFGKDAAEQIGDMIVRKLKLSNAL